MNSKAIKIRFVVLIYLLFVHSKEIIHLLSNHVIMLMSCTLIKSSVRFYRPADEALIQLNWREICISQYRYIQRYGFKTPL